MTDVIDITDMTIRMAISIISNLLELNSTSYDSCFNASPYQ